jgi:hypothetical protein
MATRTPGSSKPHKKPAPPARPGKPSAAPAKAASPAPAPAPVKPPADWERIEVGYRAGMLSLREIAAPYAVTEGAIRKRARRDGWERDLGPKIQAKADALVRKESVRSEVRSACVLSEREIVEASATQVADVLLGQRRDITRGRNLCMTLLAELESQTGNLTGLQELGAMLRSPDEKGQDKLNDIYQAVLGLPERTKTMKALAESLKSLIALEREAFNVVNRAEPERAAPPDLSTVSAADKQAAYLAYVLGH